MKCPCAPLKYLQTEIYKTWIILLANIAHRLYRIVKKQQLS